MYRRIDGDMTEDNADNADVVDRRVREKVVVLLLSSTTAASGMDYAMAWTINNEWH